MRLTNTIGVTTVLSLFFNLGPKSPSSSPNAQKGFRLLFSATPFPGYKVKLEWRREEYGGNWYFSPDFKMEGWLCPALFKYFDEAPKEIYVKAEPKIGNQ